MEVMKMKKLSKRAAVACLACLVSAAFLAPAVSRPASAAARVCSDSQLQFQEENGKTYAYLNDKKIDEPTTIVDGSKSMLVTEDGLVVKGWASLGGNLYYFGPDGYMKTGVCKIGKKTYKFSASKKQGERGALQVGVYKWKGKKYFFSLSGKYGKLRKISKPKGDYKAGTVYGPYMNASQRRAVKKQVKKFVNTYTSSAMTDYEKVAAAHDYLVRKVSYSYSTNYAKTMSDTAYGALVRKKAQCSGYSRAMKALCDAMGVKCKCVHAAKKSVNPNHQWNMVKIGKSWYHIDAQANDSSGFDAIFLTSDRQMKNFGFRWSSKMPKAKKNYTAKLPMKLAYTLTSGSTNALTIQ